MSKLFTSLAILVAAGCLATAPPTEPAQQPVAKPAARERPADASAIEALNAAFTKAYNKGDAKGLAALFTKDAEISDESGAKVTGRDAIAAHFAAAFEANPQCTIALKSDALRFLGSDAARETGTCRVMSAKGGSPEINRYTVLFVRQNGQWFQDIVEESTDPNMTAHDRLLELEWLTGDWIDENDDAVVNTSCRWSDDKNFLVRDFTMHISGQPFSGGTQRIGWDAGVGGFRSWVFDSDGGHSMGLWTKAANDQWVIRAEGVLADGRNVAATQVITFVRDGMARWQSIDRSVDGAEVADLPEIVLVRTPPKPRGSAGAAK